MIRNLWQWRRGPRWSLLGYDTFAGETYFIPGSFRTRATAERAARRYLKKLEKTQPTEISGGQAPGGIQDRVFVVDPDGARRRVTLDGDED